MLTDIHGIITYSQSTGPRGTTFQNSFSRLPEEVAARIMKHNYNNHIWGKLLLGYTRHGDTPGFARDRHRVFESTLA
jgi:hypothetical protein